MKKLVWIIALALVLMLGCAAAETVELPGSLKIIEDEAFLGDTSIEKVVVKEGVTSIGSRAFAGSGLEFIRLPDSLDAIADDAFDGCENLTVAASKNSHAYSWASGKGYKMYVPLNVTAGGYMKSEDDLQTDHLITFFPMYEGGSKNLYFTFKIYRGDKLIHTEKTFNSAYFSFVPGIAGKYKCSITIRDEYGFEDSILCTDVDVAAATPAPAEDFEYESLYGFIHIDEYVGRDTSITVPKKIDNLPVELISFFDNDTIKSVALPSSIDQIGGLDFWCMGMAEGMYVPPTVKSIGSMSLCDMVSLKNFIIPGKVTEIEDHVFWGCADLRSIMIPSSVTKIGTEAFADCYNLRSVYIPASVKRINPDAFIGCSKLTCIVEEDSYAHQYCIDNNINYVFHF